MDCKAAEEELDQRPKGLSLPMATEVPLVLLAFFLALHGLSGSPSMYNILMLKHVTCLIPSGHAGADCYIQTKWQHCSYQGPY